MVSISCPNCSVDIKEPSIFCPHCDKIFPESVQKLLYEQPVKKNPEGLGGGLFIIGLGIVISAIQGVQTLSNVLQGLILPIYIAFLYMYFKAMRSLNKEERKRFKEAGNIRTLILFVLLIWGIYYYNDFWFRLAFVILLVIIHGMRVYQHQNKLEELQFDPVFRRSFLRTQYVGCVMLGCVLLWFLQQS